MLKELELESTYIFNKPEFNHQPVFLFYRKRQLCNASFSNESFYPSKPISFFYMLITWKFKEMIKFRDKRMKDLGLN